LRAVGERVELKTDHFGQDTEDSEWLAKVGSWGWIVLSKDKHLKHNHIEIVALLKSGTYFLHTHVRQSWRAGYGEGDCQRAARH
jgi:hypothetical protein